MDGQRVHGAAPGHAGKTEEAAMDAYLRSKALYRKKVAKDGSCLFRAVAEQVLHSQARHLEIRRSCITYLRENRTHFEAFIEGSFEEYLKRLENPQEWVGQVEISALSLMFNKDFIIYQEPNVSPARVTDNGFSDKIMLCFSNGNHYDIIYPATFAESAATCQSVIYELLYEKVFGLCVTKHVSKAESFDPKSEEEVIISEASGSDGENEIAGDNPSFADMNGFKSHKDGKLPQRKSVPSSVPSSVLRSLNPGMYRNVEYEVWMKSLRDQQKLDFSIAAGMQYSVGDKCQVRLEPTGMFYNAHIQEVGADNGPAVVFVEELGKKHVAQLKNLKPVTLNTSSDGWNTVAGKKIKKTSASGTGGHIEKDYRGQKNYKVLKVQPPPSRLQQTSTNKQHGMSADQATPIENKGRSRTPPKVPGRKLEQGEEPSYSKREVIHFGLTPEERREKQVIEESKSLYEMQNRDTDAFPALSAPTADASIQSSDALPLKKLPALTNEKSTRRKSEAEDQKNKASKLAQPPKVTEEKLSEKLIEEIKPLATSESVVLQDVTVLPTPAEQQTPTSVPSVPAVVPPWSAEMPISPRAGTDSILQPQVTSAQFSPLPVSIPAVNPPLLPMPQALSAYQDPLYPGFPVNEKERATAPPPYSLCKNGDDLPTDKSILRFFYNLGIKAYTCPMWPPHAYLHPLHQAYLNVCRMYPNVHVYPQSHWVQEAAVNQSEVDPSVFVHQSVVRNENQSEESARFCPAVVHTPPVQIPIIGEEMPTQANSSEERHHFQPQGSEFEDVLSNKTVIPQPPFGQGSYMGPLPVASPFFPHVWYGYPYQGFIENPVVRHNVFINPQEPSLSENLSTGTVLGNHAVQSAINQPHHLVSEPFRPLLPSSIARESGSNTTAVVKEEPTLDMARMEQQKLPANLTIEQEAPLDSTEIPEGKKSIEKEIASVTVSVAQIMPPEERPPRAREESSEDEREVSNMLSSGRSKNFYNQSFSSRRPRNDRHYQTNRGGYQYTRTDEGWRGQRGREDGYYRNRGGRPYRRRQYGDAYKPQHE